MKTKVDKVKVESINTRDNPGHYSANDGKDEPENAIGDWLDNIIKIRVRLL